MHDWLSLDSLSEFGKHVPQPETRSHPPDPTLPDLGLFGGSAAEPTMKEFEEIFSEEFAKEVFNKIATLCSLAIVLTDMLPADYNQS